MYPYECPLLYIPETPKRIEGCVLVPPGGWMLATPFVAAAPPNKLHRMIQIKGHDK